MRTADQVAAELALAYQYREAVRPLEQALAALTDEIPAPLALWVAQHALQAVVDHVAGQPVAECPWDRDGPDPLHRGLAELWWDRHLRFLEDYREGRPFRSEPCT